MTNKELLGKFELFAGKLTIAEIEKRTQDMKYYEEVLSNLEKEILKRMEK